MLEHSKALPALLLTVTLSSCSCEPVTIPASGELVLVGDTDLHDAAIDLGKVLPAQLASHELLLRNVGNVAVAIQTILPEGGDTATGLGSLPDAEHPFAIELTPGQAIEPGGERRAIVRFRSAPSAKPGVVSSLARLTVTGAEDGKDSVLLRLSTTVLGCPKAVPPRLEFGPTLLGREATLRTSIVNASSYPIELRADAIPEPLRNQLWLRTRLPLTVAAGSTAEVVVAFQPTTNQPIETSIGLLIGSCSAAAVEVSGVGVERIVDWTPKSLDCGWVPVGEVAERIVTFTNIGQLEVRVSDAQIRALPGATTADFGLPPEEWQADFTIPPGGSFARTVRCTPTSLDYKYGSVAFSLDVPGQGQGEIPVMVAGGGPKLVAEPVTLSFGRVAQVAGQSLSRSLPLRIRNQGTAPTGLELEAALRLGSRQAGGGYGEPYYRIETDSASTSPEEFEVIFSAAPGAIAVRSWLDLTVRVTPRSAGGKRATLVLYSNDFVQPETRIPLEADALSMPPCQYRVLTPELDFGVVHAVTPRTLDFVVENLGTTEEGYCLFRDVRVVGAENGFELAQPPLESTLVGPGEKLRLPIILKPRSLPSETPISLSGTIRVETSNDLKPHAEGRLSGSLGPACMVFNPGVLEFGVLAVGERSFERVPQFINVCWETVRVRSVTFVDPENAFELRQVVPIPEGGLELATETVFFSPSEPREHRPTQLFGARFVPSREGRFQARVVVQVDQGGYSWRYVVPLNGGALASPVTETETVQRGGDPVDIVLHVSPPAFCSEVAVEAHTDVFETLLRRSGSDFHLGVLSAFEYYFDNTHLIGGFHVGPESPERYLTSATPNLGTALAAKITSPNYLECIGINRHWWGRSTDGYADIAMWRALTPPMSVDLNAGFRRSGARLALLSADSWTSYWPLEPLQRPFPWFDYPVHPGKMARAYMELAGAPYSQKLDFAALHEIPYSTCLDIELHEIADQAWYTSMILGGTVYSSIFEGSLGNYCTANSATWRKRTELLAETAAGMRIRFPLPTLPDLAAMPVEVYVNDAAVPPLDASSQRIWSYDSEENVVRFTAETTPLPGSRVRLRYRTLAE